MTELLTSAQMRAVEGAAIESGAVTGLALMERAGEGVVAALLARWPELADGSPSALVLCGPGNNGGDGFVVARLLAARGWRVTACLWGDRARMGPDAGANHDRWAAVQPVLSLAEARAATEPATEPGTGVIVDALFGTGLTRALPPELVALRDTLVGAAGGARRVAVDLPSGLDADTGRDHGACRADLTVSFHRAKRGHYLGEGPALCGQLVVAPIGLPEGVPVPDAVRLVAPDPARLSKRAGHKYAHGHALVLAGGPGQGGAARLAARAALRVGAGLVTLACPPDALPENAARLDAVMLRPLADSGALTRKLGDARLNALCLGPALGLDRRAEALVGAALAGGRPAVLDADALTLLARAASLRAALTGTCVLTPHEGEFARLAPDLHARMRAADGDLSRVEAVRELAGRLGCVVLLKGPATVIAEPGGRCALHAAVFDRAAPWLATAGAGDVLSGLIAGLLARGLPPFDAACQAAWLHVEAARAFGPGLIAEDLPDLLPKVLAELG